MTTRQSLSDEELGALASEWRLKALRGELHARGFAHEFEAQLRQRAGAARATPSQTNVDALDLRPLDLRMPRRRWWRLW